MFYIQNPKFGTDLVLKFGTDLVPKFGTILVPSLSLSETKFGTDSVPNCVADGNKFGTKTVPNFRTKSVPKIGTIFGTRVSKMLVRVFQNFGDLRAKN